MTYTATKLYLKKSVFPWKLSENLKIQIYYIYGKIFMIYKSHSKQGFNIHRLASAELSEY